MICAVMRRRQQLCGAAPIQRLATTTLLPLWTMDLVTADPTFGCDCNSEGSVSPPWLAATSEPYTFEGTSNPEASSIDIVLNFTGSGSSWPADMAVNITDPNGQCIAFGGYNSSPAGCTSIGGYQAVWPASWAAAGNGTFTATVDLTSAGLAGTGQWSLALYNGWKGPDASRFAFTLTVCAQ